MTAAADELLAALGSTVIAERHGEERPGASGISIYFPGSELYEDEAAGAESYATIADSFAQGSLWENFLNFHYFYEFAATDRFQGHVLGLTLGKKWW